MIKTYIYEAIININKMNNKDSLVLLLFQRAQESIAIPYCLLVSIIKRYNNPNLIFHRLLLLFIFMKNQQNLKFGNLLFYRHFKNTILNCLFVTGLFRNNLFIILIFSTSAILIVLLLNFVCCPSNHFRKCWMDMNSS